jgi:hypothetical protein
MTAAIAGVIDAVDISVVELVPGLNKNLLSYVHLEHKGMPLVYVHARLGHQSYAAIEELAPKPESGLKLTGHEKPNCIACAGGKQTGNNQSEQDSGNNTPINRIGGVICSDLKGPITPVDRSGSRCMIDIIDYKTNNCRVLLATKPRRSLSICDALIAASKFNASTVASSTETLTLFCQITGVARQLTEPNK